MRKALALFLIVVFVFPLLMASLSLLSVNTWVLDRHFYEDLLGNTRLYEALLSEDLPVYISSRLPVKEADLIPASALGAALREVVSPEDLRAQSLRLTNNFFDWLEGRTNTLDLYLDTTQLKAAVQGAGAQRFARALATHLPPCSAGQPSVAAGSVMMRCMPSNTSVDQATGQIVEALPTFVQSVPDRVDLQHDPINIRVRNAPIGFTVFGSWGFALTFTLFFAAGLWLVTALVADDSLRTRLMWLGWSLIVPAALIFMIGMAINSPFTYGWVRFGLNEARFGGELAYSTAFRDAIITAVGPSIQTIANGFLAVGAASGAIALGLIIWGWYTPSGRRLAPQPVKPETVEPGSVDQGTVDSGQRTVDSEQ